MILVSEADIFFTESLRILAERLSQSEIRLPLRLICYNSPPEEVGVFSTEIKTCEIRFSFEMSSHRFFIYASNEPKSVSLEKFLHQYDFVVK